LKIDPNWPSVTLDVRDPVQLTLIRLVINTCRREVSDAEKRELIKTLKELVPNWTARDIAEAIGYSERWVRKYMPEEFKEPAKVEAGREAAARKTGLTYVTKPPTYVQNLLKLERWYPLEVLDVVAEHVKAGSAETYRKWIKAFLRAMYDIISADPELLQQALEKTKSEVKA